MAFDGRKSAGTWVYTGWIALALGIGQLPGVQTAIAASRKYTPPEGFGGHAWETPLREFARLVPDPVSVQTAYSRGKVTELDIQCVPRGNDPCDLDATLRAMYQRVEGDGFHALAEYYVDKQGFSLNDNGGVVLHPVLYQFCSSWGGFSSETPDDIQQRLKLCGVRLYFQSETLEALQSIADDDYVTNYEHVLRWLIEMHGEPEGYGKRGRVVITTPNERIAEPRKRRFSEWRWCSLRGGRALAPLCSASVVLTFDPESGKGLVLYATRPVWEFAYAQHNGGSDGAPLYKLLHGLYKYSPPDQACTGSHLCRPSPPKPISERTLARFRIGSNESGSGP